MPEIHRIRHGEPVQAGGKAIELTNTKQKRHRRRYRFQRDSARILLADNPS